MKKIWHDEAWETYVFWQNQDKKTLKRINRLLKDIDRNGYRCTGKPEPLKGNLSGYWSVRIDEKNRIVFRITGDILEIVSYRTKRVGKKPRNASRMICSPYGRHRKYPKSII